jgi:endonuclease/exonuclease/phosphatase family metal-dependent hydrolase
MRIATYNVNGINGRLGNLLGWLDETAPDIVCLQELKAPDEKFGAAYCGLRRGLARTKELERVWRSWRGEPSRRKPAAACRAILTIRTAAMSRRQLAA